MKKSLIFCAALLASAFAFQSCDKVDNPGAATMDEMTYDLARVDFATIIDKYTNANNELYLPAGAEVTIDKAIELEAPLYIIGDKKNPAKIVAKAGFITNSSLIFENVEINATEVETPFILLPPVELKEGELSKKIDLVAFINSKISGLKYQFIYANKQSYLVDCINIQKSVIAYDGSKKKTIFDFNSGGNVAFLGVSESTIFANPKVGMNGGFFSSQSSKNVPDLGGTTQAFAVTNSTLYNITNGNDMCTFRSKDQAYISFRIENSILANCGKNKQFYKGFAGGSDAKKSTWEVSGNVNNWDGADTSADETVAGSNENVKNPVKIVVAFADAEKGDFTQTQTTAGDPRWIANAQ